MFPQVFLFCFFKPQLHADLLVVLLPFFSSFSLTLWFIGLLHRFFLFLRVMFPQVINFAIHTKPVVKILLLCVDEINSIFCDSYTSC